MVVELTYNEDVMHGDDPEGIDWFRNALLAPEEELLLHSNEIGDTVGEVKVLSLEEEGEIGGGRALVSPPRPLTDEEIAVCQEVAARIAAEADHARR